MKPAKPPSTLIKIWNSLQGFVIIRDLINSEWDFYTLGFISILSLRQKFLRHFGLLTSHEFHLRRDKTQNGPAHALFGTSESLERTHAASTLAPIIITSTEIDVLDWRIDQQSPHAIIGRQVHCTSVSC